MGAIHIPYPMGDDQALFTIGAQKMAQGASLYKDFWDAKQPGIYLFYYIGGKLFGFNEVGIHFLEVLYMIALSVVLIYTLRDYFEERWMASLVPLISLGFYYGSAGVEHHSTQFFTQVEALVGLPLYLALWSAVEAAKKPRSRLRYLFSSGLAGGIVLLFKLIFLPILIALWLLPLFLAYRNNPDWPLRVKLQGAVSIVSGALVATLATAGFFSHSANLSGLLSASFVYPISAAHGIDIGPRIGQLFIGFQWFLSWSAPLLALGVLGIWASLRRPVHLLTIGLLVWVFAGLFVILIQVLSWWSYHYLLLVVPLGILGTKGIEFLWVELRKSTGGKKSIVLAAGVALLFASPISTIAMDSLFLVRHHFAWTAWDRSNYQGRIDPRYDQLRQDASFFSDPNSLPGDIFVLGPYVYYLIVGRNQRIARNGESPDELTVEGWNEIDSQLASSLPPYIFVADSVSVMPRMTSSGIPNLLQGQYLVQRKTDLGTWYVLQSKRVVWTLR